MVTVPAGHNDLPHLATELTWGDALSEIDGTVLPADAPDLQKWRAGMGEAQKLERVPPPTQWDMC